MKIVSIVQMLAVIAGLLALQALALYLCWMLVLHVVRFVPLVGRRHRHARWTELNRGGSIRHEEHL